MKISLKKPTPEQLKKWLDARKSEDLTYAFPKATQDKEFPSGFDHDRNACLLGVGDIAYKKAKEALQNWVMFPSPWITLFPPPIPFEEGKDVALVFHLFGVYFYSNARIVYLINEANRFGFAYGTLQSHIECGEEAFFIERKENGEVWLHIQAFSHPNHWLVWLGKPVARYYQRKFIRDGFAAMKQVCGKAED